MFQDSVDRIESGGGQVSGLWSGPVMQTHQLHPLQQQQLQRHHQQQQQIQQQLMMSGHGNMQQLVGHQHQSPPGLGLNMMIGGRH